MIEIYKRIWNLVIEVKLFVMSHNRKLVTIKMIKLI